MWIERASNPHEDGTGVLGRSSAPFEGKPVGGRAIATRGRAGSARFCAVQSLWQQTPSSRARLRCLRAVPSSRSSPASLPRGDGA